jgi:hypothetical protein
LGLVRFGFFLGLGGGASSVDDRFFVVSVEIALVVIVVVVVIGVGVTIFAGVSVSSVTEDGCVKEEFFGVLFDVMVSFVASISSLFSKLLQEVLSTVGVESLSFKSLLFFTAIMSRMERLSN